MPHCSVRRVASILGLAVLLVAGGSAGAQTGPARVVKDINSSLSSSSGSDPGPFVEFQGGAFFTAFAPGLGKELWKSDGTEAGTVLVKDVAPGPAYSYARDLTVVQDTLFFYADDEVHGFELWKSDGTEAGTVLVKDINPGPGISFPLDVAPSLASAGGLLFFVANDDVHGSELWKSDGTESGTSVVKEIGAGGPAFPGQLTAIGDTVVFVASDGTHGGELWKSDGTAAGTEVLLDLRPGSASSNPWVIGQAGGLVYFTASFEPYTSYSALLRTDGTSGGTFFVKSFYYLYGSRGIEHGGALFFTAQGLFLAPAIWRSDGSADGTGLVGQFPSPPTAWIAEMTAWRGDLYVVVGAGIDERLELWKMSDAGETTHLKDFRAGGTGTFIYSLGLTAADGALVFRPFDPAYGFELWRTDGTAEGTVLLRDIRPGVGSGFPFNLTAIHGAVFLAANDGVHLFELWKTDGTEATLVKDINAAIYTVDSSPSNAVAVGKKVFFQASTSGAGYELWESDGTEAGTFLVKDIRDGSASSQPVALTVVGDTLFFVADDGVHGRELWKTDGTEAGTVMVKDIRDGLTGAGVALLNEAYGRLFFAADDGVHGSELWRSDGTEEGTVLVKDINPGPASSYSDRAFEVGGTFLFVADDGLHGRELWRTDGSDAGTALVEDIRPGTSTSLPTRLVKGRDTLFFVASDGVAGAELWKSDGTEGGTRLVKDIWEGGADAYLDELTPVDGNLFFTAYMPDTGQELWKSDGTEEGTVLVKDTPPDTEGPRNLAAVNGTLFFSAWDEVHERELWRSDGTEEGTVLVQDLAPGIYRGQPAGMTLAGNRLFFAAYDAFLGRELWAGRAAVLAHRPDRALRDLGDEVRGLGLPIGIERSLLAKLRAAGGALGQREGGSVATGLLDAFVRQVEGLSSKQVSRPASASLLDFAQEIVALLDDAVVVSPPALERTGGYRLGR